MYTQPQPLHRLESPSTHQSQPLQRLDNSPYLPSFTTVLPCNSHTPFTARTKNFFGLFFHQTFLLPFLLLTLPRKQLAWHRKTARRHHQQTNLISKKPQFNSAAADVQGMAFYTACLQAASFPNVYHGRHKAGRQQYSLSSPNRNNHTHMESHRTVCVATWSCTCEHTCNCIVEGKLHDQKPYNACVPPKPLSLPEVIRDESSQALPTKNESSQPIQIKSGRCQLTSNHLQNPKLQNDCLVKNLPVTAAAGQGLLQHLW